VLNGLSAAERRVRPHSPPDRIKSYIQNAWDHHGWASRTYPQYVVTPSFPIGWFGDLDAYFASPVRIVTVGLNPSGAEFPRDDPGRRFPDAAQLLSEHATLDDALYVRALNSYFEHCPYRRWFDGAYRDVLAGMDAAFYAQPQFRMYRGPAIRRHFTALHTDLLSVVATDPTWSKLPHPVGEAFARQGVQLWRELIDCLEPDVVIASISARYLNYIVSDSPEWHEVKSIQKKRLWGVRAANVEIGRVRTLLVHAPAQRLPFGPFTASEKQRIGSLLGLGWQAPKLSHLLRPARSSPSSTIESALERIYHSMGAPRTDIDSGTGLDSLPIKFYLEHTGDAVRSWQEFEGFKPGIQARSANGMTPLQIAWWLDENFGA
jgi:hypothetical protein